MNKFLKSWILFWFWFIFTILMWIKIYAIVDDIWTNPTDLIAVEWTKLTSENWNKVLSDLNYLNTEFNILKNSNNSLKEKINILENSNNSLDWAIPSWMTVAFNTACPDWWTLNTSLQDRFIVWAWKTYALWNTWWNPTITWTVWNTALTVAQMPNHNHPSAIPSTATTFYAFSNHYRVRDEKRHTVTQWPYYASSLLNSNTWNTWWWQAHTHTFAWWTNLPPFVALNYCTKN